MFKKTANQKVKNGKTLKKNGKKTRFFGVSAKKSLQKIGLIIRVVIKKFRKKIKKNLVE